MAVHRPPQTSGRFRKLLLIVLPPLALGVGLAALLLTEPKPATVLDANLCPDGQGEMARAVFLVDLRKPLGPAGTRHVTDALRDVTLALPADSELRVYTLTGNETVPRQLIRRFCKPYGNEALTTASAKEKGTQTRDCDDLPAQISEEVRENAKRFCAERAEVVADIERLIARPLAMPVPNAYLVEAIEETVLEFGDLPGRRRLFFFFSDMMQHAAWYSHVERGQTGWGFNDFIYLREMGASSVGPQPAPLEDIEVTVFYLPRNGWTDMPRPKMTHKAFWRRYFLDVMGREPVVRELPKSGAYEVEPLMERLSEAERLARERERLKIEREKLENAMRLDAEQRGEAERIPQAEERVETEQRQPETERQVDAELELADEAPRPPAERETEPRPPAGAALVDPVVSTTNDVPVQDAPTGDGDGDGDGDEESPQVGAQDAPTQDVPTQDVPTQDVPTQDVPEVDAVDQVDQPQIQDPPPAELATPIPSVPDVATADPQTDIGDETACSATLMSEYRNSEAYPRGRRVNFGSATMVLEFVLNEQGHTEDGTVRVVAESSSAARPQYFDMFATEAKVLANRWQFEFDAGETNCSRRQTKRAKVEFQF